MKQNLVFILGFLAQALFSARILVQWILSERAKKVVSPTIFWIISLLAAYLLFIYGWLRDDFAIMLGQVIAYYIYIWNLAKKGVWEKMSVLINFLLIVTPIAGLIYILYDWDLFVAQCLRNEDVPIGLIVYGSLGQVIFTFRFIFQYLYSKKVNESVLPAGFWIISIIGSVIIVSYGVFRLDPVIVLGQSFGFVSYIRNIMLLKKNQKQL